MEKQLIEMLEQLHNKLKGAHSVDDSGRKLLGVLMADIQQLLDQPGEDRCRQHPQLVEQITEAIHYFEASHPKLVLTMKQVIDTMSNMGI